MAKGLESSGDPRGPSVCAGNSHSHSCDFVIERGVIALRVSSGENF